MAKVRQDFTGMHFGRLTVIEPAEDYISPRGKRRSCWLCECDCENHTRVLVVGSSLTRKKSPTRSCGCIAREEASKRLKKYNQYNLDGEYGVGLTYNTNVEFYFDKEDYELIKDYCWIEHITHNNYHALEAVDTKLKKIIRMHFVLMGETCDHINKNPLDNRRSNLRIATQAKNRQNTSKSSRNKSGIIGVCWLKKLQQWQVMIGVNNKNIYLGCFTNKEDAIKVRLNAEVKYFGEFAPQIHLFEQYGITYKENTTK